MHTSQVEGNRVGTRYMLRLLYRRREDAQIVGVVESLEDGTRHTFVNRDELWTILMRAGETGGDATNLERIVDP